MATSYGAFQFSRFSSPYLVGLDRPQGRGGGLALLTSLSLAHYAAVIFEHAPTYCEIMMLTFHFPGTSPISLANAYYPKGFMASTAIDLLFPVCNSDFVIVGDFNYHHISWDFRSDTHRSRLRGWISSHGIIVQNNGSSTSFRRSSKICHRPYHDRGANSVDWLACH